MKILAPSWDQLSFRELPFSLKFTVEVFLYKKDVLTVSDVSEFFSGSRVDDKIFESSDDLDLWMKEAMRLYA